MYRTLYSPQGGRHYPGWTRGYQYTINNYLPSQPSCRCCCRKGGFGKNTALPQPQPRNICGNYPVHDELEEKLAKFKGRRGNTGIQLRRNRKLSV